MGWLWLLYQEQIQLKKQAQWRKWRWEEAQKEVKIGILNMGGMNGRIMELVDVMERRGTIILCI